jgi:hypothetical protein
MLVLPFASNPEVKLIWIAVWKNVRGPSLGFGKQGEMSVDCVLYTYSRD